MKNLNLLLLILVIAVLPACDSAKQVLGFNRTLNDEFGVAVTKDLDIPSDFTHLPDPVDHAAMASDRDTNQKARDAAFGKFSTSVVDDNPANHGQAETEILAKIGVDQNDPAIRQKIDKENKDEQLKNKSFVKDLLHIKENKGVYALDPFEEKKRLEKEKSNS